MGCDSIMSLAVILESVSSILIFERSKFASVYGRFMFFRYPHPHLLPGKKKRKERKRKRVL